MNGCSGGKSWLAPIGAGGVCAGWLLAGVLAAAEPVDYLRQIKPVLQARCYACHGALKQQAALRLDTAAAVVRGGDSGPAIEAGKAAGSLLVAKISATGLDERMPPEGEPLSAEQIALIGAWIDQGARAPADDPPERDPRDHWAFRPAVRPSVPPAAQADWNRNPIDAFIAAERERRGLAVQPRADARVWLRRVYLDLIGLPPGRAELDALAADDSPLARAAVVDRLLDSPAYAERWARHWMDIWRYSDWWGLGAEVRNSQKHMWHWRDWIIDALAADKPYDQMLREMLAADELYPADTDRLRATGFLARQYFRFNRTTWLDETIEHTSKAMLGLTFNCAKCHDHKYDPITQQDYYRLRAVFEPYQVRADMAGSEVDFERDGIPSVFDCNLDAPTYLHVRGDDRNPDKSHVLEPGVPAFLAADAFHVAAVALPPEAHDPGLRPAVLEANLKAADEASAANRQLLAAAQEKLAQAVAAEAVAAKTAGQPAEEKSSAEQPALVRDVFSAQRPDIWQQLGGRGAYADGRLVETADGPSRAALRLKSTPPEDFEARLRFRTTGGQTWKSVGIAFDIDGPHESLGYVSAYAGGPKAQVCYKSGADFVYPNEGAQSRPIELNRPYELTLRVRGTLVNLLVDGELAVAYELPVPRRRGAMQILAFDATAEFLSFELRALPAGLALSAGKAAPAAAPPSVAQARLWVVVNEQALAKSELQPGVLRARAAAQRARSGGTPAEQQVLAQAAVQAERTLAVAAAAESVAYAQLELAKAGADKRADVEKKLADAQAALETARQAVDTPGENFTPLAGALKTPESNLETEESRRKPFPATSSGRRTALARWLTDPANPLPARVAVNQVWMRHFGRPLVPTVFDFGRKGAPPSHPELLDWLAVELVEHGWSLKYLHRLIVTSQTYALTSSAAGAAPETLTRDPENHYYWRAHSVRMDAQVLRDSLLQLAGELDTTRGGPSIAVADEGSRRRSLYFVHSHNEHQKFLATFNDASVLDCYRRAESIVPEQALALENSPLAAQLSEKIARRLTAAEPGASDRDFVRAAFLAVLACEPSESELALATAGLARLAAAARTAGRPQPESAARSGLVQALVNHNDFITIR